MVSYKLVTLSFTHKRTVSSNQPPTLREYCVRGVVQPHKLCSTAIAGSQTGFMVSKLKFKQSMGKGTGKSKAGGKDAGKAGITAGKKKVLPAATSLEIRLLALCSSTRD